MSTGEEGGRGGFKVQFMTEEGGRRWDGGVENKNSEQGDDIAGWARSGVLSARVVLIIATVLIVILVVIIIIQLLVIVVVIV